LLLAAFCRKSNPLNSPTDIAESAVTLPANNPAVSIIGTGKVGRTLARRLASSGYRVYVGSRNPHEKGKHPDLLHTNILVDNIESAVRAAPICILAIPWKTLLSFVQQHSPWNETILIDCSNPLNNTFDGLELGHHTSAAEEIAKHAQGARVVKALNTASVEVMNNPSFGETPATMFFCGDDESAKQQVHHLLTQLGFSPIDCGPLQQARNIEPLAMLYIHLAVRRGFGSHFGFTTLRR
jgi:predicted dinucleotide-binding enzyme